MEIKKDGYNRTEIFAKKHLHELTDKDARQTRFFVSIRVRSSACTKNDFARTSLCIYTSLSRARIRVANRIVPKRTGAIAKANR